jgi:hypothetical protein
LFQRGIRQRFHQQQYIRAVLSIQLAQGFQQLGQAAGTVMRQRPAVQVMAPHCWLLLLSPASTPVLAGRLAAAGSVVAGGLQRQGDPELRADARRALYANAAAHGFGRLQMASPSPVPPYLRVVELSAWEKGWNSRLLACSVRPMPVSLTQSRSCLLVVAVPAWRKPAPCPAR